MSSANSPFNSAIVFSWAPRPHTKANSAGQGQRHVGGDGGLEVAVVRGEQIELKVLRGGVADVLAVDHHAHDQAPLGDRQAMLTQ
jgi:hypothetical protein